MNSVGKGKLFNMNAYVVITTSSITENQLKRKNPKTNKFEFSST